MVFKRMFIGTLAVITALLFSYGTASAGGPAQRITFAPGATSTAVQAQLAPGGFGFYVLTAQAGQTMAVTLSFASGGAVLSIYGADGNVLLTDHVGASHFNGVLPITQDYFIVVEGNATDSINYTMSVSIPPLSAPLPPSKRIQFAPGASNGVISGQVAATATDTWVLSAFAGQSMSLNLSFSSGQAILIVYGADGNVILSDHAEASSFSGTLPSTEDYYIAVRGNPNTATSYTLSVSIPPTFVPPSPHTISFAPGATSASVSGQVGAAGMDHWALSAQLGQTMAAQLTFSTGQAILIVYGADGTVLLSDHAGVSAFTGILPATQVYYIDVRGNPSNATSYTLTVTIPPLTSQSPNRQILFAPGADSAAVQGLVAANSTNVWVLHANGVQSMLAQVIYSNQVVIVSVAGADGTVLQSSQAGLSSFSGVLPSSQDYLITVTGNPSIPASYTLTVTIPPQ